MLLGRGVDVCTLEVLLDGLTSVDVLEHSDLDVGVLTDAHELPSEEDLDSALVAFLKSNLVGVRELEDRLVRGPVLQPGASGGGADKLVSAEDRLVVQGVEVRTLALVGDSRRVVDVVAATVHPSVVKVALNAGLVIELMHEDVVGLVTLVEFW